MAEFLSAAKMPLATGMVMRVLWQSFVDATQNPSYLDGLSAYLNQIAARSEA
jgi:hypothetical protein